MPIPKFLSPAPIALGSANASAALGGSGAGRQRRTAFRIERQEQDNWCWSAVGVSVERFYDAARTRSQCALACTALGRQDCCGDGADDPGKCDTPWYLDRVLKITGNIEDMTGAALSFNEVRSRIDQGAVVGCRIGWHGGGGHFVVVFGYFTRDGRDYLDIGDPWWMDREVAYDEFPSLYQSGGDWTHTYLTRASGAGGAVATAEQDDPDLLGA
ncbi:papain-like cysteine protease family protein [Methylobacterium sp. JK268]